MLMMHWWNSVEMRHWNFEITNNFGNEFVWHHPTIDDRLQPTNSGHQHPVLVHHVLCHSIPDILYDIFCIALPSDGSSVLSFVSMQLGVVHSEWMIRIDCRSVWLLRRNIARRMIRKLGFIILRYWLVDVFYLFICLKCYSNGSVEVLNDLWRENWGSFRWF